MSLPGPRGLALGFVVTTISWAFGAGSEPCAGLVLLTLTAIAVGAVTTVPGAIGADTLCWAFYPGFVLVRAGTLSFEFRDHSQHVEQQSADGIGRVVHGPAEVELHLTCGQLIGDCPGVGQRARRSSLVTTRAGGRLGLERAETGTSEHAFAGTMFTHAACS